MKRLHAAMIILMTTVLLNTPAHAQASNVEAPSCILIDEASGEVLYAQNADKLHMFPASTTKIMTAILALENSSLDRIMTASKKAVTEIGKDGMNIGIQAGEEMRMSDLLDAMLIKSANEAANIIAENISGTREAFVELMNNKAKELGAVHTHFTNPIGAHDEDHYTTVRDMAIIARYAMTLPAFRERVMKKNFQLPPTNKHETWPLLGTTNKLLRIKSDLYSVTGIKTGYTNPAGQNLVASAQNGDGMELISVVFGTEPSDKENNAFSISTRLLDYGFRNFSLQEVIAANEPVKEIEVEDAKGNKPLKLVTSTGWKHVLPLDRSLWKLERYEYIHTPVKAPVTAGDVIGYLEYRSNGISISKVDIIASANIEKSDIARLRDALKRILYSSVFSIILKVLLFLAFLYPLLRLACKKILRRAGF